MVMTSNTGRGMTADERDDFLSSGAIFAKIATTMDDGWPVLSPVWFEWFADDPAFLVVSKERTSPHYSRLAADLSEASGIGRVDGGFRGGFSLRVGD